MALDNEYLVVGRTNGTTRTGSAFCTRKLKTLDDEMTVAVWDVTPDADPQVGQLVSFSNIQDNDGKKSARKNEMMPRGMAQEGHPLYHLLPRPIAREEWDRTIEHLLTFCTDAQLRSIITEMADVLFKPYSQYPAATSVHHAYRGGLLNHTHQMLHMLEGLYPCLPYAIKVDRCILAILFHDYGKVYEYSKDGETQPAMYLLGHIYISANRLQQVLKERDVPNDEADRIVHIVLSHHGQLDYGSPVVPCTQEAVIVNLLDNLSAKADNIESTGNGEKSFALGTHVVK